MMYLDLRILNSIRYLPLMFVLVLNSATTGRNVLIVSFVGVDFSN